MKLHVVPCMLRAANAYVSRWHRHHKPVRGCRWSVAVADEEGEIHGVAIGGRPVARHLQDGLTAEVYRVATDGTKNACSALYGACRRIAFALGYHRLVTFTLRSESGTSLRASGYRLLGEAGGGSWSRSKRPRVDKAPTEVKLRWEVSA